MILIYLEPDASMAFLVIIIWFLVAFSLSNPVRNTIILLVAGCISGSFLLNPTGIQCASLNNTCTSINSFPLYQELLERYFNGIDNPFSSLDSTFFWNKGLLQNIKRQNRGF